MNYIINYSSGGLGNRLLPLASCGLLANVLNRKLGVHWPSTLRCMGQFKNLFSNDIKEIDISLLNPDDCVIYSTPKFIHHDSNLNNLNSLLNLYNKIGCISLQEVSTNIDHSKKFIIVYNNTLLSGFEDVSKFLKELVPVKTLKKTIDKFSEQHNISKNVLGIHARSTDFLNSSIEPYLNKVNNFIGSNQHVKILFCSDNPEWEAQLYLKYPDNIIIREKKDNVRKQNENSSWINNALTSELAVQEAVIDIFLLAKTNFVMYNKDSTFAHLVNFLK
jgi:hypothetical protein